MAAGLGNPVGYVPVFDGGNPGIISGRASVNLSGGMLVFASGAAGAVSSGLNSFVTSDVAFAVASGNAFTGVVTQSAASGTSVAVATKGKVILVADGTVTCGATVICIGANAVQDGTTAGVVIGRAVTSAASGGFAIIDLW